MALSASPRKMRFGWNGWWCWHIWRTSLWAKSHEKQGKIGNLGGNSYLHVRETPVIRRLNSVLAAAMHPLKQGIFSGITGNFLADIRDFVPEEGARRLAPRPSHFLVAWLPGCLVAWKPSLILVGSGLSSANPVSHNYKFNRSHLARTEPTKKHAKRLQGERPPQSFDSCEASPRLRQNRSGTLPMFPVRAHR